MYHGCRYSVFTQFLTVNGINYGPCGLGLFLAFYLDNDFLTDCTTHEYWKDINKFYGMERKYVYFGLTKTEIEIRRISLKMCH